MYLVFPSRRQLNSQIDWHIVTYLPKLLLDLGKEVDVNLEGLVSKYVIAYTYVSTSLPTQLCFKMAGDTTRRRRGARFQVVPTPCQHAQEKIIREVLIFVK